MAEETVCRLGVYYIARLCATSYSVQAHRPYRNGLKSTDLEAYKVIINRLPTKEVTWQQHMATALSIRLLINQAISVCTRASVSSASHLALVVIYVQDLRY